jgi:uncharacterized delta-60 repeat protein
LESRTLLDAGALDTAFGASGKVISNFQSGLDVRSTALARQADGKLVVAGVTDSVFAVARYNADGTLDTTFGTGGKVRTDFGSLPAAASGVAVQRDGTIIVVGTAGRQFPVDLQVVVARYRTDGSLDPTFGSGGKITGLLTGPDTGLPQGFSAAFALQPDGKLVLGRVRSTEGSTTNRGDYFAMTRLNADGTRDSRFSISDVRISGPYGTSVFRVLVQADTKIVVVTTNFTQRYNTDGSWDVAYHSYADTKTAALQPDDRLVVAGGNFTLRRYNANATLDTTFASPGIPGLGSPSGVLVQPDGRIVVSGSTDAHAFALARFNPDGSADATFGSNGAVTTHFSSGSSDMASDLLLQPDGKIVVAGTSNGDFALARYLGDQRIPDANQRFISQVYLDLLQRPAEPAGLNFWSGLIDQGMSRTQVVLQIENSPEYHALEVQRLYGLVLGRAADPSGQTAWASFLNQGGTAEQLEASLLASAEYFTRAGGTSDRFLEALYRDTLQRTVDTAGASGWGQLLTGGMPRSAVAAAVLASPESDRLEAQGLYRRSLRRAADSGGLSFFAGALQQGVPNETVLAGLVGSDEYFSRL